MEKSKAPPPPSLLGGLWGWSGRKRLPSKAVQAGVVLRMTTVREQTLASQKGTARGPPLLTQQTLSPQKCLPSKEALSDHVLLLLPCYPICLFTAQSPWLNYPCIFFFLIFAVSFREDGLFHFPFWGLNVLLWLGLCGSCSSKGFTHINI